MRILLAVAMTAAIPSARAQSPSRTGAAPQSAVRSRIAELPGLTPAPRLEALTSIVDEILFLPDDERRQALDTLGQLAAQGAFYSPTATEPSLLWFQYERARRRGDVAAAGTDPAALATQLERLLERRRQIQGIVAGIAGGGPVDVHNLTSFGWHGAGEVLEAVADVAARTGADARAVGAELAAYLACEKPHPLQPHVEDHAGVGEPAPSETEAQKHPVLWGDGYRFALARAVLATQPAGIDLSVAHLHLLYSPRQNERLAAIAWLRLRPLDEAAVTHLAAQLADADRLVVREAVLALGQGAAPTPAAAVTARDALRRLAEGSDRELRLLAAAALRRIADR